MGDRFASWQRICNESEESVNRFNSEEHAKCPFCGGSCKARWDYAGDYDLFFVIECENCEARVKSDTFDECVKQWERRVGEEQKEKSRIELQERVTKAEEKVKSLEGIGKELESCLESAFKNYCSGRIPCDKCFAHEHCVASKWREATSKKSLQA